MTRPPLAITWRPGSCRIRLDRPETGNAIDTAMVEAFEAALDRCENDEAAAVAIVTIESSGETFCVGGDLEATAQNATLDPERLYRLWQRLRDGPFVSIVAVNGRANAGGVGFVAAADIAIGSESASFALSEMLFGLYPACVLPFLNARIGAQRAHYLTLTARPIDAAEALREGLLDSVDADLEDGLRRHILRLRRLTRPALARYKAYRRELDGDALERARPAAVSANRQMFSDPVARGNVARVVDSGRFPWEVD